MLYYFVTLLTAALILLFNDYRSRVNRWAAFFLISASLGGLGELLPDAGWTGPSRTIQLANHTLTPYGVLMFCISYAGASTGISGTIAILGKRYRLALLLGIPPLLTAAASLLQDGVAIPYLWLLCWAGPYYIASCCLLIRSFLLEHHPRMRRNRFITAVIIVPTALAVLIFINIAKAFDPAFDFFRYISVFIIYSFALSLLSIFIYGVLGVRLRFEREPLDSSIAAVGSGAALLNHTIKNEIGKISLCTANLQAMGELGAEAHNQLQIISRSSEQMLAMVERIHSQTKVIRWNAVRCDADQVVALCAETHRPALQAARIELREAYESGAAVMFDPVHLREALGNLITNAMEAMPGGGLLTLRTANVQGKIHITVADTGGGMSEEQMKRAFEPFYSTKKRELNFGLGLSYVYKVIRTGSGTIKLTSKAGEGTELTLILPHAAGGKQA